jgi:hypothetical protein
MSSRPRHRRAPDQRGRQLGAAGTGLGIAVGGAMAAAFVSMGPASADNLLGPVTPDTAALAQPIDPTALSAASIPSDSVAGAVPAAAPTGADAFISLVASIDPNAFTATGAVNDYFGTLATQIDSDLANTVFGPELNQLATQFICADTPTCEPTLVIVPPADDDPFADMQQFLVADSGALWNITITPDLQTTLATIATQLDTYFAATAFGPELDTIADQVISAFTTTAF